MKKHRVCTTISAKHWDILKKHTEKYETQQKALEFALESLENAKQNVVLSQEEELWMRIGRELKSNICVLHKNIFEELIESAGFDKNKEILTRFRPAEYIVVWYLQKPLKKCSLKEVIEGIVFTTRNLDGLLDTINYTDEISHYNLKITHTVSMKVSKLINLFFEDLFKAYGVKTESDISESSVFMKIYKNCN